MWSRKRCEAEAASEADGIRLRQNWVSENQTRLEPLASGLITQFDRGRARYNRWFILLPGIWGSRRR